MFMRESVLYLDATNTIVQGYSMWVDEIVIPEGVRLIRNEALRGMRKLKYVSLPESLEAIQSRAFMGTGLRKVTIPKNVADIRLGAFANCGKLEEISVSDKNRFFTSEDGILYNKEQTILIQYPAGRAKEAFSIPEGVIHIMPKAFAGCRKLKCIYLPQSLTTISERAFCECNGLEEIVIPEWIKYIDKRAFAYCKSLRKVFLARGTYIDYCAFEDNVEIIYDDDRRQTVNYPQRPLRIKMSDDFIRLKRKRIKKVTLSRGIVEDDSFATEINHIFSTRCEINKATGLNDEIYKVAEVGKFVLPKEVLIGKTTAVPGTSPESRFLAAMFGDKLPVDYKDSSVLVPYNVDGVVTNVEIEYAKDKNGNQLRPKVIESVTVKVKQSIKAEVGDILVDEKGNECIVEAIKDDLQGYDLIANFPVAGKLTKKTSAKQALQYRAVGYYSVNGMPIPTREDFGAASHIVADVPQYLTNGDLVKLVNQGFSEVAKNIILNQSRERFNSVELYANVVYGKKTSAFYMPYSFVNRFINFMYAMCIKPVFRDKNKRELEFSYTNISNTLNQHYGEDITLELVELDDNEIREKSYGEVTSSGMMNYRTSEIEECGLLSEKIFGPTRDWECRCGHRNYNLMRSKETVCKECGVEFCESKVRYERIGHIELGVPVKHPFLKNKTISALPVLPPELRPHIKLKSGRYLTDDLNALYKEIILLNNYVRRLGTSSYTERLQNAVNKLMLGDEAHSSLLDRLAHIFVNNMNNVALDYSASCLVMADISLSNEQCALPYEIAATVFKPYLIAELCKQGICYNIKTAVRFVDESICDVNYENRPAVIKCLESVMNEKKVLLLSNAKDGKVLALTPMLTTLHIAKLNLDNYSLLEPKLDETIKVILPVSDAAQNILRDIKEVSRTAPSFYDIENDTDFIKEISELASNKQNIIPRLSETIRDKEVCSFKTFVSRWLFGMPAGSTWKIYELPVEKGKTDTFVGGGLNGFKEVDILGGANIFDGFAKESTGIDNMFDTGEDDDEDIFSALAETIPDVFSSIFGDKDDSDMK